MPVLSSYRNQSIDLHCKSIDWFLYEGNTRIYWVNVRTNRMESTKSTFYEEWSFAINSFIFLKNLISGQEPLINS